MDGIILCKTKDGFKCPYLDFCLARLTDRSITGCGMPLYVDGLIKYEGIRMQHTINAESEEKENG